MIVNKRLSKRLLPTGLALSALMLCTIGCGDVGDGGNLRLIDQDSNHDGSLAPIAEGANVIYRVGRSANIGNGVPLVSFSSSDPGIFSVESPDQRELLVTGKSVGSAALAVEAQSSEGGEADASNSDTFALEVRPIKNIFYAFTSYKSNITTVHGGALATAKLNLLPDAMISTQLRYYVGPDGERLSGEGAEVVFSDPVVEGGFRPLLRSTGPVWNFTAGEEGSTWSADTPFGAPLRLRAKTAVEVASLQVFSGASWRSGQLPIQDRTIRAPRGSTVALTFQLVDADGYAYIGAYNADGAVTFSNAEGFAPRLGGDLRTEDGKNECVEGPASACSKWANLESVRFVVSIPDDAAETTIKINVGAFSETYTLKSALTSELTTAP